MKSIPKYIKVLLQILVTVVIFTYIFVKFDINFYYAFANCSWWYLVLACCIRLFVSPLLYINRWKTFLKYSGIDESFFTLLKISMMSAFAGIALPSSQGADVVRMVMIEQKHHGEELKSTSSSTVIMERLIGFVIWALLGLIFSCVMNYPSKGKVVFIIALINVAIWSALFVLTNKSCYAFIQKFLSHWKYLDRVGSFLDKTYYSMVSFPYRKVLFSTICLILLLQLCSIAIVYCVFLAFGVDLPFTQHLAFYPIIGILSMIPVSISGLGLREGFFVSFYSLVGVTPEIAVTVSLVNYMIETLLVAILGGILYGLKAIGIVKV